MRKQDKIIIWPAYFDVTKTRRDGRRVAKSLAVPLPKIMEIKGAAERLGLKCELVENVGYSKMPWLKTGMLLVDKNEAKEKMLEKIAEQLAKIRSTAMKKD